MVLLKRSVLLILISNFFVYFGIMMIIAFMPQYMLLLGTPRPILQIISTIFLTTLFIFPYIFGKYSDKIQNRRYFIIIGTAGMIVTPFLLLFTTDLILITLIYFILGVFASASSIFFTLYTELVQNNSKWISYYNALTALGWFIGVQIAGIFIEFYGSITIAFYLSFFSLLISMVFIIFIKEDRQIILKAATEHIKVDIKNSESNHDDEILFSKSIYFGIFFRSMGIQPIMVILVVIMGFHLSSNAEIGFLIGLNPLLQFFLMVFLGMLFTGKNEKFFMFFGYCLSVLVIFGFLLATNFWSFLLSQFLVALSYSIYWMATITYISKNSTPKNKGKYIGFASTCGFAGNALGGLFLGFLLIIVNSDYYIAMYFMLLFPILALLLILLSRKKLFSLPKGVQSLN
ncbi:MAG: MFS transporter [Promethearchaeota archaeon]